MTGDPIEVVKRGYKMDFSHEYVAEASRATNVFVIAMMAASLGESRREKSRMPIEPTAAQIAEYQRLRFMLDEIEASDLWEHGYDGGYLREPTTTYDIEYAETWDEYAARIRAQYDASRHAPLAFPRGDNA